MELIEGRIVGVVGGFVELIDEVMGLTLVASRVAVCCVMSDGGMVYAPFSSPVFGLGVVALDDGNALVSTVGLVGRIGLAVWGLVLFRCVLWWLVGGGGFG